MITIRDGDVYQWDSGRQIEVDSDVCEVHFASCNSKDAYVTVPVDGVCNIPNILLQTGEDFVIYAVCQKDECEQTVEHLRVWVKGRAKPSDYVYTEIEVFDYKELEERIKQLEQSSGVADLNYEKLSNKPMINGVELNGNLSTEDLNIEVSGGSGVSDVTVNGTSIVADGVANIPVANAVNVLGLVKYKSGYGVRVDTEGQLMLDVAQVTNIDRRSVGAYPITCERLDYAVKQAMTDGKGAQWTSEEKASARERMGIDLKPLLDAPLIIEDDLVGAMSIELPQLCERVLILVKQSQDTAPITLYNGIIFDGQNAGGAGNLLSALKTVPNKYVSFEITVLWNGLIECVTNINSTVSSGQSILNEFPNYVNKKIAKVGLSSISATLPKGTEVMILGR